MGREPRSPRDVYIQGRPEGRPGERPQAEYHAITADYFTTLEIPLRAGRDFDRTDTPERPRVAIVNETLARTAFPGESPIGHRIQTGTNRKAAWMAIVGVVGDTRWQDPSQPARAVIYAASTQGAGNSLSILARTSLDSQSLAGTLRTLLHDANPTVPVKFETMDELFDSALAYPRFRTQVIGLFAGVAVVLAAVGIFSVLAYLVGQRTRELAIRRALGARTVDVIPLIIGQGLRLVAIGLVLGLAGALTLARLMTGLLFEISPWDAGIWTDAQAADYRRIADFVRSQGTVPGIQLAHAGRKASMQRPWFGNAVLGPADHARGDDPWPPAAFIAFDGESTWIEGASLIVLYAIVATAFWWG